jgi:flavin reductase (DIM6/NTAB) family NADH-FMN oxidoreductase RutF
MGFKSIKQEELYKSIVLLQPSMPFLVTTLNKNNSINIAPFSWGTPISQYPPMMSLALLNKPLKQDSLKNIERTGELVFNLIDIGIAERVVAASYEYSENVNKFVELNFKSISSEKIKTPGITEARACIECKVKFLKETGDHMLIVSEIVAASFNPDYYSGNLLIDLIKTKPLIHLEHYMRENGQVHVFVDTAGCKILDVPYKKKLDI